MTDIQQRIAEILSDQWGQWVSPEGWADYLAEVLVSELKLRELPTSGYLDPMGYLHMGTPDGETAKDYVQYISGWHEA